MPDLHILRKNGCGPSFFIDTGIEVQGGENNGSKDQIKKNGTEEGSFLQSNRSRFQLPAETVDSSRRSDTYDPNQEPSVVKIDAEKAQKWLANGAKPTETVAKILKVAGVE